VREAENGKEAISLWKDWNPHLILMDMRMPVMDGYEATQRIRNEECASQQPTLPARTPIIALTASSFEEDRTKIISCGCDDFLGKPFREAELFEMMHTHLGVRYVYQETGQPESVGDEPPVGMQQTDWKAVLSPDILADLPPESLEQLEQAVDTSSMKRIASAIDAIRAYNAPVANALAHLASDFHYDEMLTRIRISQGKAYEE
jgi:CheY-like chemotaxis protein